jgi:hypothetical protein
VTAVTGLEPIGAGRTLIRFRGWIQGATIFACVFVVYAVFTEARDARHHVYLAEAILHGSFDVGAAGMPTDYIDTVQIGSDRFVPFPPGPAILLLPFVAVWGTAFSQAYFSAALGALNVVLLWQVLRALDLSQRTSILATVFFTFGTVHFYAATTGGVWQYSHVAAVFFLLVAVLLFLRKAPLFLVGVAFGFAVISRSPALMAAPFFLYLAYRQHNESLSIAGFRNRAWLKDLATFCAGLVPFGLLILAYNYARFDSLFDTGYQTVYETYIQSDTEYSYYRHLFPDAAHFGLFDIRNIPLHIHAMFLLTPDFTDSWLLLRPSPFGMSVLLTSPAFLYAFLVRRKTALKPAAWLAIGLVTIPLFLHYSQGWVQFGYRFLLDYAPFLMILTAFGFDDNQSSFSRRTQFGLVAWSVAIGIWGVAWAHHAW